MPFRDRKIRQKITLNWESITQVASSSRAKFEAEAAGEVFEGQVVELTSTVNLQLTHSNLSRPKACSFKLVRVAAVHAGP